MSATQPSLPGLGQVTCTLSPRCQKQVNSLAGQEDGRMLLIETPLARIARQIIACLISTRWQARKARIDKFELDEGFHPYHPPF